MMRVILLLVAAFLVTPTSVFPQATAVLQTTPGTGASTYQAPPRDTAAKTGTARIRGHVYAAENGAPLRRAQVRIFAPELRDNRVTSTNEQGAFEFRDLPAGRYTVNASKGNFVSLQYGQTRPSQGGTPLQILDGQTVEKIDFALPRGAIITGRVVDDYGEPVADAQVASMQSRFVQGRRQLTPSGRSGSTNDIGEFRIFALPPGQYYIGATLRNFTFGDSDDHMGFATTYYPGTANPAEAQRIKVDIGQSVSEVNITLVATRTARISGSVTDAEGRPVTTGGVMAFPRGGTGMFFGPAANGGIKPDGTFTVSGLAPGDYTLRANVGMPNSGVTEFATAQVTINGEDVNDVHLMTAKMIAVTGRLVVLDGAAAQPPRLPIRITLTPMNPDDMMFGMGGGGGNVKDDFTFELQAAPGKFRLIVGTSPGWTLWAVRDNGVDVTDSGIEVRPGRGATDLEVALTNRVSDLSGLVTNTRGEIVKDYTVMVFAQDRERWSTNTRYRGGGRPDQDGRYKVRALPAGDYYAIALDYLDPAEAGDPELLERLMMKSTPFTLGDGETKSLDLKVQTGG